jgi:hypothetical protein
MGSDNLDELALAVAEDLTGWANDSVGHGRRAEGRDLYKAAECIETLVARLRQAEAATEYWQDLAGDIVNADSAWERYGLSCHRKWLDQRAEVVSLREALAAAEAVCEAADRYQSDDMESYRAVVHALAAWRSSRPVDPPAAAVPEYPHPQWGDENMTDPWVHDPACKSPDHEGTCRQAASEARVRAVMGDPAAWSVVPSPTENPQ